MSAANLQGGVNVIAWSIVIGSAITFVAAAAGVAISAMTPPDIRVFERLHDTYYIIAHSRRAIWAMLVCMLLASLTGLIGYVHTDAYVNRVVRKHVSKAQS